MASTIDKTIAYCLAHLVPVVGRGTFWDSLEKFSFPVFTRLPASSDLSMARLGTRLAIEAGSKENPTTTMLPIKELDRAIEIQGRAFKLLQWLSRAIREGFIPLTKAHEVADAAHATKAWIEGHYHNLPFDCRPEQSELEEFANFFGSYLDTSFDIVEAPAERYVSECGCYCPMCRRLANPQHLKAKSLTKVDKNRAAKLRVRRIEMLALEEGLPFNELSVYESLQDAEFRHSASLSAYGSELLERLNGFSDGPAVLALWRDFAWTAAGAPNRQFKLKAELIHQAEQKLTHIVREHSLA